MSKHKLRGRGMLAVGAIAVAVLAAAPAMAEIIAFENPAHGDAGHFHWAVPSSGEEHVWLDWTLPADEQPGVDYGDSCFQHRYNDATPWGKIGTSGAGTPVVEKDSFWIAALSYGETIPSGATTSNDGYVYYEGYSTPWPEGTPAYVGVHFDIGAGTQYAWIGVVRTVEQVEAFAWGYETTPGVSIEAGVPEPGTLALLALGAVGVLRRRR